MAIWKETNAYQWYLELLWLPPPLLRATEAAAAAAALNAALSDAPRADAGLATWTIS